MSYTIDFDTQLMNNVISANPITQQDHFIAFVDAQGRPALFSLSEDGKLLLICQDQQGTAEGLVTIDFGSLCQASGPVTGFNIRQATDTSLFIAFTVQTSSTTCSVNILPNLPVAQVSSPNPSLILGKTSSFPLAETVYLSDYDDTKIDNVSYPKVVLDLQTPGKIYSAQDLGLVKIDPTTKAVSLETDWSLPINVDSILDVSFGSCAVGNGVFVLYSSQGSTGLIYSTYDGSEFNVPLTCPPGSLKLASYFNNTLAASCLVVGGTGLWYFDNATYVKLHGQGVEVCGDQNATGVQDVQIVQDDGNVTIWFANGTDAVGYYAASSSDMTTGALTMLLPEGKGSRIAPCAMMAAGSQSSPTFLNTVICVDDAGALTMLLQDATNGAWTSSPLAVVSPSNNMNVQTYTIRVKINGPTSDSVSLAALQIASSSQVKVISNGVDNIIGPQGSSFVSNSLGELTILLYISDISCSVLDITGITDHAGAARPFTPVSISPSQKVVDGFAAITDAQSLETAKTQSGQPLLPGGGNSDTADAASIINSLATTKPPLLARAAPYATASTKSAGPRISTVIAGRVHPKRAPNSQFILDVPESVAAAWYWLSEKASAATEWFIHSVDNVYHFMITLASESYDFILDGITSFGKCLSWVFSRLQVALDTLIDYIGFIFNWQDILATKQTISDFINASLSFYSTQTSTLAATVVTYLENLKSNAKVQSGSTDPVGVDQPSPPLAGQATNSVGYNWTQYQLAHGGGISGFNVGDYAGDSSPWTDLWNNTIIPQWNSISSQFEIIGSDISDLLNAKDSTTMAAVFSQLSQDAFNTGISCIQAIVDAVLNLVSTMITFFQTEANASVEIPVLSALYREISGNHCLTLLDAVSLVIAVPATVLCKAMTNNTPPTFQNLNVDFIQSMFSSQGLPSQESLDMNTLSNLVCITGSGISTMLETLLFFLNPVTAPSLPQGSIRHLLSQRGNKNVQGGVPLWLGTQVDKVNVVVGIVALGFSFPLVPPYSSVDPGIAWAVWGCAAARQGISVVSLFFPTPSGQPPSSFAKGRAGVQLVLGVTQFALNCVAAAQGPQSDVEREAVQATLTVVSSCCKSTSTLLMPGNPVVAGALQGIYIALTYMAIIPLQGVGLDRKISGIITEVQSSGVS